MEHNCLNCNTVISNNFCANCGQKKYKRIDRKYIWDEIQYTVLHTNKGFLYSVKNILKNPGKTARDFIDGNRVNHYKPILLTFVLSGISTFLSFKILGFKEIISNYYATLNISSKLTSDILSFMSSYSTLIMTLLIPVFALITKIAFRKWGHNYYEHVVMNSFILSFYTLLNIIILYPIVFFTKFIYPDLFFSLSTITFLLTPIMLLWFFKEFYNEKPFKSVVLRIIGILGLMILSFVLLMLLSFVGIIIFAAIKGPEALEYMKAK